MDFEYGVTVLWLNS